MSNITGSHALFCDELHVFALVLLGYSDVATIGLQINHLAEEGGRGKGIVEDVSSSLEMTYVFFT